MLRLLVLLLVLLNAIYYAWSHEMLRPLGFGPQEQSEPQRVQQQLRADAVRILSAEEARKAEQAAALPPPKPPECLQAGVFDETQTDALRKALEAGLPQGSWVLDTVVEPARWIIYMGKFANNAARDKKKAELDKMKLASQPLEIPELQPGLSLAGFESQAQAQTELAALQRRGVRTARVVQERPELRRSTVRIPTADDALRSKLDDLKSAFGEKTLHSCDK